MATDRRNMWLLATIRGRTAFTSLASTDILVLYAVNAQIATNVARQNSSLSPWLS